MYKIEGKKLKNEHISFEMPNGYYIDVINKSSSPEYFLKFVSHNYGKFSMPVFSERIDIEIDKIDCDKYSTDSCEEQFLEDFLEETYDIDGYEFFGNFIKVTRGKRKAVGAYYRTIKNRTQGYLELRKLDTKYNLLISIFVRNRKGEVETEIFDVMRTAAVKNFFNSIKYL